MRRLSDLSDAEMRGTLDDMHEQGAGIVNMWTFGPRDVAAALARAVAGDVDENDLMCLTITRQVFDGMEQARERGEQVACSSCRSPVFDWLVNKDPRERPFWICAVTPDEPQVGSPALTGLVCHGCAPTREVCVAKATKAFGVLMPKLRRVNAVSQVGHA